MCVKIYRPSIPTYIRNTRTSEYMSISFGRSMFLVNWNTLYWLRSKTLRYKRTDDELWNERCLMIGPLLLSWIHYKQPWDMRI